MGYSRLTVSPTARFGSVREKLDDPAYSGFFLKFDPKQTGKYHVPQCDTDYSPPKCSDFYHDQEQSPGHPKGDGSCKDNCDCGVNPCGEYLWDHRNGSMLQEFLLEHYIGGSTGVGNPAIDGLFIDGEASPPTVGRFPAVAVSPPQFFSSRFFHRTTAESCRKPGRRPCVQTAGRAGTRQRRTRTRWPTWG